MKKYFKLIVFGCLIAALLYGCGGITFSITSAGNKTAVKINKAPDGKTAESGPITVGRNMAVTVDSSLDKGKVQIDFVQVINIAKPEETADYVPTGVVITVTVSADDHKVINLDEGEYLLDYTAIGETNGTLNIDVVKAE